MTPYFDIKTEEAANLLDGLVSVGLSQIDKRVGRRGEFPVIRGIQTGTIRYKRADPNEHWQSWREIIEQVDRFGVAGAD